MIWEEQMAERDQGEAATDNAHASSNVESTTAHPIYRKPVLRKYDQIEQVKPYGPSEMESG